MAGLPPAVQVFSVDAAAFLAGIDEMLERTGQFAESLDAAVASAARMGDALSAAAGQADESVAAAAGSAEEFSGVTGEIAAGAERLAGSATAAADGLNEIAAAAGRAAEGQAVLSDAEKAAADSAQLEAEILASLRDSQALLAESAAAVTDGMASEARAMGLVRDEAALAAGTSEAAAGKMDAAAGAAAGFGSKMKMALLGVGLAAVYGIDKAAGFQSSMEQLHTQAGVAQSKIAGLSQGVLQLAGQVGEGPDSLSESLYHVASNLASTGASGAQMLNAVKVAAEGAQVGNANLVDVTNALGAAIASGIPGVQNYTQAMGYMNATVGAGDMTMQNLAEAFGTGVLANIKMYGVTLQDVSAALATFGDNNIRGAKAGTDLRMAVQAMVAPVSTAGASLKAIGLNTTSFADAMKNGGLNSALELLVGHLKSAGVSSKDYGEMITDIFGKKAGSGIGVLVGEFSRFQGKYKDVQKGADEFAGDWASRTKTMAQQWDDLKSGAQALAISFGTILLPAATRVVGALARFAGLLEQHPALAAFAGALLGIAVAFKVAAAAEKLFSEEGLASLANPAMLAVMAVAALAFGLYELYEHSKLVRDIAAGTGHALEAAFRGAARAAEDAVKWFGRAWDAVSAGARSVPGHVAAVWDTVAHGAESAGHAVSHAFSSGWDDVYRDTVGEVVRAFEAVKGAITSGFDGWWKTHGKEVEEVWGEVWRVASGMVKNFVDDVKAYISAGVAVIKVLFRFLEPVLKGVFAAWMDTAKAGWAVIKGVFSIGIGAIAATSKAGWDLISGVFKAGWDVAIGLTKVAWSLIAGVVKVGFDLVAAVVKAAWDIIVGIFSVTLDLLTGHWSKAWDDMKTTATQVMNALKGFLSSAWDAIKGAAIAAWNDMRASVVSAANAMRSGVVSALNAVISFFAALPGKIMAVFAGAGEWLVSAGEAIIQGLIHGVESAVGGAISAIEHVGSEIKGAFSSVMSIFSPSRVFYGYGTMITQGLADGIAGTAHVAASQATALAATVREAYEDPLSKTMQRIGLEMAAGLLSSLASASTASAARSAVAKMVSYVQQAWSAGDITTSAASRATSWLEADNKRLQALAQQRQSIAATIKTADAYAASTASSTESWAGLGNITGPAGSGPVTGAGILAGMRADLSAISKFTAALRKLGKMGLSRNLLSQIIQMGPGQGLQYAQALADGPLSVITSVNKTQARIDAGADSLGHSAAEAMYDSGAMAGKGFLSGLAAQQKSIEEMMDKLADAMVTRFKSDLKIHSPSLVMDEHGQMVAAGLIQGMERGVPGVKGAARMLAVAAVPGGASGKGTAGAGAGGNVTYHVDVTVNGFVGDNQELGKVIYDVVQEQALIHNRRNGHNGLSL